MKKNYKKKLDFHATYHNNFVHKTLYNNFGNMIEGFFECHITTSPYFFFPIIITLFEMAFAFSKEQIKNRFIK